MEVFDTEKKYTKPDEPAAILNACVRKRLGRSYALSPRLSSFILDNNW